MSVKVTRLCGGLGIGQTLRYRPACVWDPSAWAALVPSVDATSLRLHATPMPEPLATNVPADTQVERCMQAWAALGKAAHQDVPSKSKISLRRRKAWPKILEGVEELRKLAIPPELWVYFAFALWADQRPGYSPPFAWVMSATLMRKHAAWARDQADSFGASVVAVTPAFSELASRTASMNSELSSTRPSTSAEVRRIVARHFAAGEHATLVDRVMTEAHQARVNTSTAVARGVWPWRIP